MEKRQQKRICLAQNFLRSSRLVRRLVGMTTIGRSDIVYEIGPGNGIITAVLAGVAGRVIAIEKDSDLVPRLRERFRALDNVEIVGQDFLTYRLRSSPRFGANIPTVERQTLTFEYKMFANIPYNSTSQIVRKIINGRSHLSDVYLILQKEAARKFSGYPTETLFSVLAKPWFEFRILFQLRRSDFWPVPQADSVLLSIRRRRRPLLETQDAVAYREFVQYGFRRRKPNLRLSFKKVFTYKQWKRLARELDIPLNATPTQLSFEQWIGLYHVFQSTRGAKVIANCRRVACNLGKMKP